VDTVQFDPTGISRATSESVAIAGFDAFLQSSIEALLQVPRLNKRGADHLRHQNPGFHQ
jgi:hypothetical protein